MGRAFVSSFSVRISYGERAVQIVQLSICFLNSFLLIGFLNASSQSSNYYDNKIRTSCNEDFDGSRTKRDIIPPAHSSNTSSLCQISSPQSSILTLSERGWSLRETYSLIWLLSLRRHLASLVLVLNTPVSLSYSHHNAGAGIGTA